jgi:hypothetical protein
VGKGALAPLTAAAFNAERNEIAETEIPVGLSILPASDGGACIQFLIDNARKWALNQTWVSALLFESLSTGFPA